MNKEDMQKRIEVVKNKVASAALQCGRNPDDITIIGVSKFFPAELAMQAVSLGLKNLGENRVQELIEKKTILDEAGVNPFWHLIGNLQTNKVKQVVGKTTLIHSVSSIALLNEIEKRSADAGVKTSILLEINIAKEVSKHGFEEEKIEMAVDYACKCKAIKLCGLMSMAPVINEKEGIAARETSAPFFIKMKNIFDTLQRKVEHQENWNILSMGMSQDYETAICCGATHIRVGTAIFGKREINNT